MQSSQYDEEMWSEQDLQSMQGIEQVRLDYKMEEEREFIHRMMKQHTSNLNSILANSMDKYLYDCRFLVSEKLAKAIPSHKYHRKQFERLTESEILEYRYELEKDIQTGIHALNQVQIMEMLLQERKKRRSPEFPYRMGTTTNVSKIVEGLAYALQLKSPTPLVKTAVNMLTNCSELKHDNLSILQKKLFDLNIIANALQTVKGCDLHRDGEIGDLACRFKHLSIKK